MEVQFSEIKMWIIQKGNRSSGRPKMEDTKYPLTLKTKSNQLNHQEENKSRIQNTTEPSLETEVSNSPFSLINN